MPKSTKDLLEFWEDQMKLSHTSSNYFFRKSPSHYHMMLLVMSAFKLKQNLSVEELKTKLFKTSRPKSALIINEACEKGFFYLEKTSEDQRKKYIDKIVELPPLLNRCFYNENNKDDVVDADFEDLNKTDK